MLLVDTGQAVHGVALLEPGVVRVVDLLLEALRVQLSQQGGLGLDDLEDGVGLDVGGVLVVDDDLGDVDGVEEDLEVDASDVGHLGDADEPADAGAGQVQTLDDRTPGGVRPSVERDLSGLRVDFVVHEVDVRDLGRLGHGRSLGAGGRATVHTQFLESRRRMGVCTAGRTQL